MIGVCSILAFMQEGHLGTHCVHMQSCDASLICVLCCDITLRQPRVDGYLYDTADPLAVQPMHFDVERWYGRFKFDTCIGCSCL